MGGGRCSQFAFLGSAVLSVNLLMELKDALGFLGCKLTLLGHVQPFILQYPKVLLRAAPYPFIHQPLFIPGVSPFQLPL